MSDIGLQKIEQADINTNVHKEEKPEEKHEIKPQPPVQEVKK